MHAAGTGVPHNDSIAVKLFERACSRAREAEACFEWAKLVETGRGAVQNFQRAARLYREGCENKHAESCFRLSEMMTTGAGTWRDPRQAARYRRMACQGGFAEACIARKGASS